jgi:hypothetical protein
MIVLPLTYFGNIAYFKYLLSGDQICIDNCEPYLKQTYRNRTHILGSNGPIELTIPVKSTKGKLLTIDKIEISYAEKWPVKHWRSIESAYHSSPFFEEYQDEIKSLILTKQKYLADYTLAILKRILDLLSIDESIIFSSQQALPKSFIDYRTYFKPTKSPLFENVKPYPQVFNYKFGFVPNLSVLDLLFNEGPYSKAFLKS